MPFYRKKPVVVEAITFEDLVVHGLASTTNVVRGMPWSFRYKGHPITHESDHCYLIPTLEGCMKFFKGDMLITGVDGEIYPCKKSIFDAIYEECAQPVDWPETRKTTHLQLMAMHQEAEENKP